MTEPVDHSQPVSDSALDRIAAELRWFRILFTIVVVCIVNVSLGVTLGPQIGAYAALTTLGGLFLWGCVCGSMWLIHKAAEIEAESRFPPDPVKEAAGNV